MYIRSVAAKDRSPAQGQSGAVARAQGKRIDNETVALASGASGIEGRGLDAQGKAAAPGNRVYMIPFDPDDDSDLLLYRATWIDGNGAFSFRNIAPGRYNLVVRLLRERFLRDGPDRLAYATAADRKLLVAEARRLEQVITLIGCVISEGIVVRPPAAHR